MPEITTDPTLLILTAVLAYLLGSIPFGIVITRAMGLGDLRQIGSGNIGATNVLRTGNKGAALATLVLDAAKGGIAVLIARWLAGRGRGPTGGLSAFPWPSLPGLAGLQGRQGGGDLPWHTDRALLAGRPGRLRHLAGCGPGDPHFFGRGPDCGGHQFALAFWFGEGRMLLLVVLLTILVYIRHAENLKRIKAGTEPKIGQKKPSDTGAAT
jgi:acyl phosphate:glycerol-3-phosphate acyltransferase